MLRELTPVPPPRSTQTKLLLSCRRAALAASIGLLPHRNLDLNLSSALHISAIECARHVTNHDSLLSDLQAAAWGP